MSNFTSVPSVRVVVPGEYELTWPGTNTVARASFVRRAVADPSVSLLTLESSRVRGLTTAIPQLAPSARLNQLVIPGVSEKVAGFWSLWRVGLSTLDRREQRVLPIFLTSEGQTLGPAARVVWDRLIELGQGLSAVPAAEPKDGSAARAYAESRIAVEQQGAAVFQDLMLRHRTRLVVEAEKTNIAFSARRRAIARLGLQQVRDFRMEQLSDEEAAWRRDFKAREKSLPDLRLLLLVAIVQTGGTP